MKKRNYGYAVFTVVLVLIAAFAIYQYTESKRYQTMMNNQYQRSFSDLVDYVGNLEVELKKGKAVTDTAQMTALTSDIWRKASFAQANLGQLPISDIELENTSKFLSQVGDYTYSLSKKMLDGEVITAEEKQQMKELSEYATSLYDSLTKMQEEFYAGSLSFAKAGKTVFAKDKNPSFGSSMESVEEEFADYPSLIYDGPFSEHIHQMKPKLIEALPEITPGEAEQVVREFLSDRQLTEVTRGEDANGVIPSYCFQVSDGTKDREINISVSKQGGYPVWMLSNQTAAEGKLTEEEGVTSAKNFLAAQGYDHMKESYFEKNGNTLLVNFAYDQDGILIYTDLIKVKVSLEDGSVIGFENKGYVMNHQPGRTLPQMTFAAEEAYDRAASVMEVTDQKLAVIPLETKKEVLCYELKGKIDQDEYLIYLNAETGKQEKILLLLVSENGTLTI